MAGHILEARQIVKRFPGSIALNKVDFTLDKSEIRALLGENGAGKSTLIKVLSGIYKKDAGNILYNGCELSRSTAQDQAKIAFVPQEINLFKDLTVAENIFIPIKRGNTGLLPGFVNFGAINRQSSEILGRLETKIDPKTRAGDLSAAQLQMVQIARGIVQNFEILILDEPTSSITYKEAENLFKILRGFREQGKSIIYITHKLDEVFELADNVTILRDGCLVGTYGIDELDREAIVQKMAGRQLAELELVKLSAPKKRNVIFEVKDLAGPGFKNINLTLHEGEILGIAGLVGAKRTDIAKTIFGALPKKKGRIFLNGREIKINSPADSYRHGLVYMPEDRKRLGIFPGLSLKENMTLPLLAKLSRGGLIQGAKEARLADTLVKRFNIRTTSTGKDITYLSGGNQQKAIVARSLSSNPKVLIIDEPTVGIDVKAKSEIYAHLDEIAGKGLGLIVISSEIEELFKIADRMVVIYNGQMRGEFSPDEENRAKFLSAVLGL